MATFQHDADGFLVGAVTKAAAETDRNHDESMRVLRPMRADVGAILRAVKGGQAATIRAVETQTRAARSAAARQSSGRSPAPARQSDSSRAVRGGGVFAATAAASAVAATATAARGGAAATRQGTARAAVPVAEVRRDTSGRFVAGAGATRTPDKKEPDEKEPAQSRSILRSIAGSMARVAGSINPSDNIDPAVSAAKEVTSAVAPLGRGLSTMFNRATELRKERKQDRWYTRLLKALKERPKVDVKTAAAGGLFGGRFAGLGGGAAAAAGGLLSRVGKGAGKLLRRIPGLAALTGVGGAVMSLLGLDDDPTKSAEENRQARYRNVGEAGGMTVGAVAGGVLGSMFGPAGTLAGSVIGSIVGEKVGGAVGNWSRQLVDSDIPGKVVEAWGVTTAYLQGAWNSVITDAGKAWKSISDGAGQWWDAAKSGASSVNDVLSGVATAVNDWIKQKTGIDVAGSLSAAKEAAASAMKAAGAAVVDGTKKALGAVGDVAAGAVEAAIPNTVKRAAKAGADAARQARAGYDVARGTENTTPAPVGSVQSGARAAGGAAGGFANMIARHEGHYGSFNRGYAGDSMGKSIDFSKMTIDEIMAAQALPKGNANRLFAVGKYQIIPDTMRGAAKSMGLTGKEKMTPELQERIMAEYLTDAKRPQIAGYIKGKHDNRSAAQLAGAREWASIADPSTGRSYYDKVGNNKAGLSAEKFGAGLDSARAKYRDLVASGVGEKEAYMRALGGMPGATSIPSAPAIRGAASVPSVVPAKLPQAPEVKAPMSPMNSPRTGPVEVKLSGKDVTQDVSNRQLAHIVTGGMSSPSA